MTIQKRYFALIISGMLAIAACKPSSKVSKASKPVTGNPIAAVTPAWAAKKFDYKASRTQEFDLIHTKIEISFDWEKQWAHGKATLKLKPWFYDADTLRLDAKGFDLITI